jgi:hypothetical protein
MPCPDTLSKSCEQFLWTNVLARPRARLQALDFVHLFTGDENCGTIFCLAELPGFPRFLTNFVDKIVRKRPQRCPSP